MCKPTTTHDLLSKCNSTVNSLYERLQTCKNIRDYKTLISACSDELIRISDDYDYNLSVLLGIINDCTHNCTWLLMSDNDRAQINAGWDCK